MPKVTIFDRMSTIQGEDYVLRREIDCELFEPDPVSTGVGMEQKPIQQRLSPGFY